MTKFKHAYVQNPNFRFATSSLADIAEDVVYVCDTPMFDDLMDTEQTSRFETSVAKKLEAFNPDQDIIVVYGDPIILAMMVMFVSSFILEDGQSIKIARWSTKQNAYLVREISPEAFPETTQA